MHRSHPCGAVNTYATTMASRSKAYSANSFQAEVLFRSQSTMRSSQTAWFKQWANQDDPFGENITSQFWQLKASHLSWTSLGSCRSQSRARCTPLGLMQIHKMSRRLTTAKWVSNCLNRLTWQSKSQTVCLIVSWRWPPVAARSSRQARVLHVWGVWQSALHMSKVVGWRQGVCSLSRQWQDGLPLVPWWWNCCAHCCQSHCQVHKTPLALPSPTQNRRNPYAIGRRLFLPSHVNVRLVGQFC